MKQTGFQPADTHDERHTHTHLEHPVKILHARVDVESLAELGYLFERKLLVAFLVSILPILLLPQGLPHFEVAETGHKFLPNGMELSQGRLPHLEHVLGGDDEVEGLVVVVHHINDCKPPVFVVLRELELFPVVPGVLSGSNLLDVLDRN